MIFHPFQLALVRLLEGYWPRWLRPAERALAAWHRWRRHRLEVKALVPAAEAGDQRN